MALALMKAISASYRDLTSVSAWQIAARRVVVGLFVTGSVVVGLGAALGGMSACNLGVGTTPECDPTAGPTSDNACEQVSNCDDGTGYPRAEEGCCLSFANLRYETCVGAKLEGDASFQTTCMANENETCCVQAQDGYDRCFAGTLNPVGAGGSGSGAAGSGGAAGGGPLGLAVAAI